MQLAQYVLAGAISAPLKTAGLPASSTKYGTPVDLPILVCQKRQPASLAIALNADTVSSLALGPLMSDCIVLIGRSTKVSPLVDLYLGLVENQPFASSQAQHRPSGSKGGALKTER